MNPDWHEKADRYRWLMRKSLERLLTKKEQEEMRELRDLMAVGIKNHLFLKTSI